ncbi:hypothetical protein FRX31_022332, partial [Thalictrum thalictroides]
LLNFDCDFESISYFILSLAKVWIEKKEPIRPDRVRTSSASSLQGSISNDDCIALNNKITKEYAEPWNYYSYYPVTLPLRRPHSGNPGLGGFVAEEW